MDVVEMSDGPRSRMTRSRAQLAGMVGVLAAAAVAAGCGSSDSSSATTAAAAATGTTESTTEPVKEATGTPYEVKGTDPKRPSLRLQGWVPGGKASKEYKIGYFSNTPLNTYVQAMDYGAATAASALGVKVEKIVSEWDSAQQLNQLQTAIQQKKYDGIVVFSSDPAAECKTLSKQVPDAGIPVVIVNFPICGDSDYTDGTVGLSTSQSLPYYQQYVDWALGTLAKKGGGKVGVLSGPAVLGHSKQLKAALDEIAPKYDNVEIAQNINGEWTSEAGLQQTQTLLQSNPDLKMLLSSYDQNTLGAEKALTAAGKKPGDVMIFNLGGDHSTFPMMKEGWIQGMMYLEPIEEVGQGVEMLVANLDGAKTPTFNNLGQDKTLSAGTVQITPENIDEFVPQF